MAPHFKVGCHACPAQCASTYANPCLCTLGLSSEKKADGMGRAGSFQYGARHGLGVFTLSTKVAYCGVFQQGQRNGPGVICIGGGGISLPLWPVLVCICRAGQREAASAVNFRQDCLQHALLITDAIIDILIRTWMCTHPSQKLYYGVMLCGSCPIMPYQPSSERSQIG